MRRMSAGRRTSFRETLPQQITVGQAAIYDSAAFPPQPLSPSSASIVGDGRERYIYSTVFDNNNNNNNSNNNLHFSSNNNHNNVTSCNTKRLTIGGTSSISPVLNRSLSTPSVNAQANQTPRIFIANLDYAMKVAEYVPVLRKQLEKHGIEIIDGECYQDKADATGRNRYAVLTVASDEQVRLAKSKSNEVKVGYRKVWIYDDTELTPSQRDDILRQLRDQLAKQQAVKIISGPKPQPPYQQNSHHQNFIDIGTPPEDTSRLRNRMSLMRQSTMLNNASPASCPFGPVSAPSGTHGAHLSSAAVSAASTAITSAVPTVEITPDEDHDLSAISTPPSFLQVATPRSSDTSAYLSGASPTPDKQQQLLQQQQQQQQKQQQQQQQQQLLQQQNSDSSCSTIVPSILSGMNTQSNTPTTLMTPGISLGARAIVGRRRASAVARLETPEHEDDRRRPLLSTSSDAAPDDDVLATNDGINLIKTHGEMFLDYALSSSPANWASQAPRPMPTKQNAVNKFRQLINDVMSDKSYKPGSENSSSFLFYVMTTVNDLRKTGCDRVCFNRQQPQDLPVLLADWNAFLSVQVGGAPMELYLRMHPCVTIMRLKASLSAAGNSAPLWHMTLALDCEKWAYASNFWLESSWPSDFVTVFQMFVAEVEEQLPNSRTVCLPRSFFDHIVEDLEELERLGWLHLLGSEYDDGTPRLVGLTLPGYAALWRHAVDQRIHNFSNTSSTYSLFGSTTSTMADIDGRQWLPVADLLQMADEDELAGLRPFGLFAFVDGFTFQPQWVLAEQFSFRVAPSQALTTPDVSITCNSQRCAKRRRLAAVTDLLTNVPPGTPSELSVAFDLDQFTSDAFASCRRFSAPACQEDVIRKLPFSFQVSKITPSVIHVARPENLDKSASHLRRLSWLAMCLHAAGTLFFSLDELALLYSRLFPLPGAGPLLLESLIELCQGPLPILTCDSTSAVGLTPLGLAASSIRQALLATAGSSSTGSSLAFAAPVSRLVEELGVSVDDVLDALTTVDPNLGPYWLNMLNVVHPNSDSSPSPPSTTEEAYGSPSGLRTFIGHEWSDGATPPVQMRTEEADSDVPSLYSTALLASSSSSSIVVKLRSLFRQSVSPDVMSFITGSRPSSLSMLNIAILSSTTSSSVALNEDGQQQQAGDEDDDFERLDSRRVPGSTSSLGIPQWSGANRRRASAPLIRSCESTSYLGLTTPPGSPPKKSLLLRLGGSLIDEFTNNSSNDDDTSNSFNVDVVASSPPSEEQLQLAAAEPQVVISSSDDKIASF